MCVLKCVCSSVCVCVCVCTCMCMCVCVWKCVCGVHACVFVYLRMCVSGVWLHVCVCLYVCVSGSTRVHSYVCLQSPRKCQDRLTLDLLCSHRMWLGNTQSGLFGCLLGGEGAVGSDMIGTFGRRENIKTTTADTSKSTSRRWIPAGCCCRFVLSLYCPLFIFS